MPASVSGAACDRVEIADGYEKPRLGDQNVRRVSSVVTDAGSANRLLIEAVVLFAGAAHVAAPAACPRRVDCDSVTEVELGHSGSDFFHPSGDLVPEREGRRLVLPVASFARYHREVGVAQAGAGDSHDHLTRSGVRLGHLLKLWSCLRLDKSVREHRSLLSRDRGPVTCARS